jgi:apolipoprotein N-acyltransferase
VKVAAIIGETDIHHVFDAWKEEIIELSKNSNQEIPAEVFSTSEALMSQIERTREAVSGGAKIVVWNEMSLILKKTQVDKLVPEIQDICRKNQVYILLAFLERQEGGLPKPFNNKSLLIKPDGEIAWEYLKYFLNPMEGLVINQGEGTIPIINTEYGRIANVICADLDLSGYISQAGKESADIVLVPAFDWEGVVQYHANMAAFAAIQYGMAIIRANGKGIVAFYDYLGDRLEEANTFHSDSSIFYAVIPLNSVTTPYTVIGNLFVYVWMVFLIFIAAVRISGRLVI